MTEELLMQARAGDEHAFAQLVDPYRRELQVHCYRVLGSLQDAEDALQETLIAAWRGLGGYEERASLRTWLYRIATRRCLNQLRSASRRPQMDTTLPDVDPPEPTRLGEVLWLEPYPDVLLEGLADTAPGPEARYETREAISLAFITALQLLPPAQRAVLIVRDVLGFSAREAAQMLDATEQSVNGALKRARARVDDAARQAPRKPPPPPPNSPVERQLVNQLVHAFESNDIDGVVSLMTEDAWLRMPPIPLEYQGRDLAARFFAAVAFRQRRAYRLLPTRANGQPALGVYLRDPAAAVARANGLLVLTLADVQIAAIDRFHNSVLPHFGLPHTLPE